jgi:hypothetical protein
MAMPFDTLKLAEAIAEAVSQLATTGVLLAAKYFG